MAGGGGYPRCLSSEASGHSNRSHTFNKTRQIIGANRAGTGSIESRVLAVELNANCCTSKTITAKTRMVCEQNSNNRDQNWIRSYEAPRRLNSLLVFSFKIRRTSLTKTQQCWASVRMGNEPRHPGGTHCMPAYTLLCGSHLREHPSG